MKITIGENEYVAPFTTKDDPESGRDWFVDANGKFIRFNDACLALNELAQLRQERDELKKEVERLDLINKEKFSGAFQLLLADFKNPEEARIEIQSVLVQPMMEWMVSWFEMSGGVNYVCLSARKGDDAYEFTMQKIGTAMTPSEKNIKLRSENDELKKRVEELEEFRDAIIKTEKESGYGDEFESDVRIAIRNLQTKESPNEAV